MTMHTRVSHLLETMDQFAAFLDEETEALGAMNFDKVVRMQPRKSVLAEAYEREHHAVFNDRDNLHDLDEETRALLAGQRDRLVGTLDANMTALDRAQSARQRVVETIIETVRAHQAPAVAGYGPMTPSPAQPRTDKRPVSMSYNKTL